MSGHPNLNLGEIITTSQQKDATHVAVAPVVAGSKLNPATHVMIRTDGVAIVAPVEDCIGIIDPFLRAPVEEGQRCWLFIYPNTVTSLRHDWSHPMFPNAAAWEKFTGKSESRLREIAGDLGLTFDRLIDGTADWISLGRYLSEGPLLEGAELPNDFWEHYEKYVGKPVPPDKQEPFFSCSC